MERLTGFRDPYLFTSPVLSGLLAGNSSGATGDNFLTISSGVHDQGPRLLLYRQTSNDDVRRWTYLGPILSLPIRSSFSVWGGNFGINFETACVTRLNEEGESRDPADTDAVDFIGIGTEGGRDGHDGHWPLCTALILTFLRLVLTRLISGAAVTYSANGDGAITAQIDASGTFDWGRAYATVPFTYNEKRSVLVGWAYASPRPLIFASCGLIPYFAFDRRTTTRWLSPRSAHTKGRSLSSATCS
jgi:beta-fructofuranosidase